MSKTIVIIGATGMLGKPVTEELIKAGFRVKILTRNVQKAKDLFPGLEDIAQCDLRDKSALKKAFQGADYLYLNLSVAPEEKEKDFHAELQGLNNALDSAKETGVKRVGYISSIIARDATSDWWVLKIKRNAVEMIKNSGIPYVIFYPSNFMETLVRSIQKDKLLVAGKARYPNWWIAGTDYGKQVAKAFEILDEKESRDYIIQGPETLTFNEAAHIFANNYSKGKLKVSNLPLGLLKLFGLFSAQFGYLSKILDIIYNHPETFDAEKTWQELGEPTITVEKFARSLS